MIDMRRLVKKHSPCIGLNECGMTSVASHRDRGITDRTTTNVDKWFTSGGAISYGASRRRATSSFTRSAASCPGEILKSNMI